MKTRPIPFSGPMVRAVLSGAKTQTRRPVKLQPTDPHIGGASSYAERGEWVWLDGYEGSIVSRLGRCPYGVPGDRLWVREAWRGELTDDARPPRDLDVGCRIWYEADGAAENGGDVHADAKPGKLRPGMFMPRWASRITLEVTGVRVEPLQDISEADARAEGIEYDPGEGGTYWVQGAHCASDSAADSYRQLWQQINGPGSWDANPWVWVVEFRRV